MLRHAVAGDAEIIEEISLVLAVVATSCVIANLSQRSLVVRGLLLFIALAVKPATWIGGQAQGRPGRATGTARGTRVG